jgi:hypothetical protein
MPYYRACAKARMIDSSLSRYLAYEVKRIIMRGEFLNIIEYDDDHEITCIYVPKITTDVEFAKFRNEFEERVQYASPEQVEYNLWCEDNYMEFPGPNIGAKIANLRSACIDIFYFTRTESRKYGVYYSHPDEPVHTDRPTSLIGSSIHDEETFGTECDVEVAADIKNYTSALSVELTMADLSEYYVISRADVIRRLIAKYPLGNDGMYTYSYFVPFYEYFGRMNYVQILEKPNGKLTKYMFKNTMTKKDVFAMYDILPVHLRSNVKIVLPDGKTADGHDPVRVALSLPERGLYNYDFVENFDGRMNRSLFTAMYAITILNSDNFGDEEFKNWCQFRFGMSPGKTEALMNARLPVRDVLKILTEFAKHQAYGLSVQRYYFSIFHAQLGSVLRNAGEIQYCRIENEYAVFHDGRMTFTYDGADVRNTGIVFAHGGEVKLGTTLVFSESPWCLMYLHTRTRPDGSYDITQKSYPLDPNFKRAKYGKGGNPHYELFGDVILPESKEFRTLMKLADIHGAAELLPVIEECIKRVSRKWDFDVPYVPQAPTPTARPARQVPTLGQARTTGDTEVQAHARTRTQMRKDAARAAEIAKIAETLTDRDIRRPRPQAAAPEQKEIDEEQGLKNDAELFNMRKELMKIARSGGKFTTQLRNFVDRIGLAGTVRYILIRGSHLVFHTDGSPVTVVIPHK